MLVALMLDLLAQILLTTERSCDNLSKTHQYTVEVRRQGYEKSDLVPHATYLDGMPYHGAVG